MKMRILVLSLVAGFALLLLSGCNGGGPSGKVYVKNGNGKRLRVAVLPFDNVSREQDAGRIITNTIITYLLSTGEFDVVEPGVVYASMGSEGVRLTEGITVEVSQKLQPKLNADAYIMGMVEEFGEVRIGPDTYPSVSFSARLVDARTATILWAATISKTGADNVKVFDIGRVSSLGKLSKQAVAGMAVSLYKSRSAILEGMTLPPDQGPPPNVQVVGDGGNGEVTLISAPSGTTSATTPASTSSQNAKYMDESIAYTEKELTSLLKDTGNAKLGNVTYKSHYHSSIETSYRLGEGGKNVEVRLLDYRKAATSEKFLGHYNPSGVKTKFENLPAFTGESNFGYYHLDIAVGRFALFLRGPKDSKSDIDGLGKGIITLLR